MRQIISFECSGSVITQNNQIERCEIRDFPQIISHPDFAESQFLSGGEGAEMAAVCV